ncbi:MAG: hypothetical protein IPI65_08190 [Bacteroidetes bacterium]|nr:hypothetical protein [Bacteroidota bacterium]
MEINVSLIEVNCILFLYFTKGSEINGYLTFPNKTSMVRNFIKPLDANAALILS